MTRVLVIDNYDSFVYTLNGYLQELGAETVVRRNDVFDATDAAATLAEYDAVLLSPGPGAPRDAGVSIPMVHAALESGTPLLGVCLGHQAIAEAFGGVVTNADELMHGKTSLVSHDDDPFWHGVRQPFTATRYHSLAIVDGTLPPELVVTARTAVTAGTGVTAGTTGGVIMALKHASAPIWGVQFHPESVLTEDGYRMLGNWLESAGVAGARERAAKLDPLVKAGA